jgi:hypothetical protein
VNRFDVSVYSIRHRARDTAKSLDEAVTCGVAIRGMDPACLRVAGRTLAERWKFSTLTIACR